MMMLLLDTAKLLKNFLSRRCTLGQDFYTILVSNAVGLAAKYGNNTVASAVWLRSPTEIVP